MLKKIKETVIVRPKIRLGIKDHKAMLRAAKLVGISMSQYIRQALMRRLDSRKFDTVEK